MSGERYRMSAHELAYRACSVHTHTYTRGGTILYQRRGVILRDASGQVTTALCVLWPERGWWWRRGEGCSSRVHTLDLRRGRGLGEPGSILLDENVTCRRGESSAKADGSKANTAIRVMLAATERIIRCFAVFARYRPEVLLCSLFLFVPVVVSSPTLYAIPHIHASNIESSRQQQYRARCIIPALGQPPPSKQSSASKHRPAAHHRVVE